MPNNKTLTLLLTLASAAMLIGAWTFQYFGYPPCKMCYWQRYPHMAAVAIGALAYAVGQKALAWLGARRRGGQRITGERRASSAIMRGCPPKA